MILISTTNAKYLVPFWYRYGLAILSIAYIVSALGFSGIPGLSRSALVCAVLLSCLLFGGALLRWIKWPAWSWYPLPFLLYSLLSLAWAEVPEFKLTGMMFTSWVGCYAIGIALHNKLSWHIVEMGLLIAVLSNVGAVLIGFDAYDAFTANQIHENIGGDMVIRSTGLIGNANEFALKTIAPALLLWAIPGRFSMIGLGVSLSAAGYGLAQSGSRLGLILMGFLLLILAWRAIHDRRRLLWGSLVLVAIFFLLIIPSIRESLSNLDIVALKRMDAGLHGEDSSYNIRQELINIGLARFKESPLIGHGLGSFGHITGIGTYSHNNYVELVVAGGVLGLLLFYGIHFVIGVRWFQNTHHDPGPILLLLAILAVDMTTVSYYDRMTCLILAVLSAYLWANGTTRSRPSERLKRA